MAGTNQDTYNSLVVERQGLQEQLQKIASATGRATSGQAATFQARINELSNKIKNLEPSTARPDEIYVAHRAQTNLTQKINELVAGGKTLDDPEVKTLMGELTDTTQFIKNNEAQVQAKEQAITGGKGAIATAKAQQETIASKQEQAKQSKENASTLEKLQTQRTILTAAGQSTAAIDAQIQKLSGTPVTTSQVSPEVTNQIPNTGGSKSGIQTLTTPSSTGGGGSGGASGGGSTPTDTSGGGKYKTVGDTLNFNNQPFTGVYKDKYYNQGKVETAEQVKQDFLAKYQVQAAFIASVPELSNLLSQAMDPKNNWNADKWKLAYTNSQWFQGTLADRRDEQLARYSDKGAYATRYNALVDQIQSIAKSEGIDTSMFGGKITPDKVDSIDPNSSMGYLMQHYYRTDPPSDVLSKYVAQHGTIAKSGSGVTGGQIAAAANDLRSYAASMGISSQFLTPTWKGDGITTGGDYFANAAQATLAGYTNLEAEKNLMKQQAMNMYKPFASQIEKGYTVSQLANPYTSAASQLLEVAPESINLGASTGLGYDVTKALQGDGTNATSLDQFMTQVKQRPEWLNTTNARNTLMDTATTLLRNFGLVVGQ